MVEALLQEWREDMIGFAAKLVQTRSYTCREGEAAALIAGKMRALGYDEVTVDETGNVLGRVGSGEAALLFDGHMDTVAVNDGWTVDPFGGEVRGGRLWGRGAADTKCPLVAAIYGAALARRAGLAGKAVYVSASTMEEDYDGEAVRLLLEKTGLRPRGAVICEPTELKIATGHRGRALIELHAAGKSCHGSTPELGVNPVYMLREVIGRVEALAQALAAEQGEHGSLALTNICCSTASNNSVPHNAAIFLDRRLALGETEELIAREMDALVAGTGVTWRVSDMEGKTWTGYPFVYHSFLPAWEIHPGHPLAAAAAACVQAQTGRAAEIFKMGCSTNGVATAGMYGIPSIVFGPGSLSCAHGADEFCPTEELAAAAGVNARLCLAF